MTLQVLKDFWWAITVLVGLAAWCIRTGWNTRKLMERIEKLEEHDKQRRADLQICMRGVYATLCGLKEQGCNGEVTKALDLMRETIFGKDE